MRTTLTVILFVAISAFASSSLMGAENATSSPEEKAKALQLARYLESNPIGDEAEEARKAILVWLIEVPDISVSLCGEFLGPLLGSDEKYSAELVTQMAISAAAFVIEHPESADDEYQKYLAGVEGALRAYESILLQDPSARQVYLDNLLETQEKGKLGQHVRKIMKKCK